MIQTGSFGKVLNFNPGYPCLGQLFKPPYIDFPLIYVYWTDGTPGTSKKPRDIIFFDIPNYY